MTTCMVMIRCPQMGHEIATGVTCDCLTSPERLCCPTWGVEHVWSVSEAWLAAIVPVAQCEQQDKDSS
jgi:hypothetical protein